MTEDFFLQPQSVHMVEKILYKYCLLPPLYITSRFDFSRYIVLCYVPKKSQNNIWNGGSNFLASGN